MKKVFSIILVLSMISSIALADVINVIPMPDGTMRDTNGNVVTKVRHGHRNPNQGIDTLNFFLFYIEIIVFVVLLIIELTKKNKKHVKLYLLSIIIMIVARVVGIFCALTIDIDSISRIIIITEMVINIVIAIFAIITIKNSKKYSGKNSDEQVAR